MTDPITAGFADPVRDAQKAFRSLLDALANPGRAETLDIDLTPPAGLDHAAAVALLTVADFETPLWLPQAMVATAGAWLRFHAAVRLVDDPAQAVFAVLTGTEGEPSLSAFHAGDDLYPDRSTTVFVQCHALEGGEPAHLNGPGIRDPLTVAPAGLPAHFWRDLRTNNTRYPRGVDVMLTAGSRLMGLPRSLTISLDPSAKEAA